MWFRHREVNSELFAKAARGSERDLVVQGLEGPRTALILMPNDHAGQHTSPLEMQSWTSRCQMLVGCSSFAVALARQASRLSHRSLALQSPQQSQLHLVAVDGGSASFAGEVSRSSIDCARKASQQPKSDHLFFLQFCCPAEILCLQEARLAKAKFELEGASEKVEASLQGRATVCGSTVLAWLASFAELAWPCEAPAWGRNAGVKSMPKCMIWPCSMHSSMICWAAGDSSDLQFLRNKLITKGTALLQLLNPGSPLKAAAT